MHCSLAWKKCQTKRVEKRAWKMSTPASESCNLSNFLHQITSSLYSKWIKNNFIHNRMHSNVKDHKTCLKIPGIFKLLFSENEKKLQINLISFNSVLAQLWLSFSSVLKQIWLRFGSVFSFGSVLSQFYFSFISVLAQFWLSFGSVLSQF